MCKEGLPVAGLPSLSGLHEPAKMKNGKNKKARHYFQITMLLLLSVMLPSLMTFKKKKEGKRDVALKCQKDSCFVERVQKSDCVLKCQMINLLWLKRPAQVAFELVRTFSECLKCLQKAW